MMEFTEWIANIRKEAPELAESYDEAQCWAIAYAQAADVEAGLAHFHRLEER